MKWLVEICPVYESTDEIIAVLESLGYTTEEPPGGRNDGGFFVTHKDFESVDEPQAIHIKAKELASLSSMLFEHHPKLPLGFRNGAVSCQLSD